MLYTLFKYPVNREPKLLKFYEHKKQSAYSPTQCQCIKCFFSYVFFFLCFCYKKQKIISIIDKEKQEQNHEVHVHLWQTRKDWLQRETF